MLLVRGGDSPPQQTGMQRLESFLRRVRRSGLYYTDRPTVAQLSEDADDTLFSSVTHFSNHLLHVLLLEHTNHYIEKLHTVYLKLYKPKL